jgi:hypothetical protein
MSLLAVDHSWRPSTTGQDAGKPLIEKSAARPTTSRERRREQRIDEELAQSFPASDPPSWVQGTSPDPS